MYILFALIGIHFSCVFLRPLKNHYLCMVFLFFPGTTWTEEIVSLVYHDGDPDAVRNKLLAYRVEHLEVGRPLGHLRHLRKLPSPRLMATHLPLPLIPKQLRQGNSKVGLRTISSFGIRQYHFVKQERNYISQT